MPVLLPPEMPCKVHFRPVSTLRQVLASHDLTLLLVCKKSAKSLLKQCIRSAELLREYQRLQPNAANTPVRLSANQHTGIVLCIFVKHELSPFEQLLAAGKAWKEVASLGCHSVAVGSLGFEPATSLAWLQSQLAAALASSAPLPDFKRKPKSRDLRTLSVLTDAAPAEFAATLATQAGNNLARWFTLQPPNVLDCASYRHALLELAAQHGWRSEFFGIGKLRRLQAGAFLAVARANAHEQAGILRLSYQPKPAPTKRKKLALVGKGICFDTGGINLKSHKGMYDMHTDMQGSAVAVGVLQALTQLNADFDIDCWLALTENEIGPSAYRPQEVVTALNGISIQVVHSDAEGRMALADTLSLAARGKPDLIIDFATLTGACVAALTERMSGAFSNLDALRAEIEAAGRRSGERVWSFPMDNDYDSDLDSALADVMQCTLDNKGDHILAARFLKRFVPESVPWVHVDLSAASRSGGLAHIPSEVTGFGVRWAVDFVQHHANKLLRP